MSDASKPNRYAGVAAGLGLGALLCLSACPEEESSLPPICGDCENAEGCPDRQPTLNPLVPCQTADAQCHYCGEGIARWTCRDPNDDGNLVYSFDGIVDDCPEPVMESDGGE